MDGWETTSPLGFGLNFQGRTANCWFQVFFLPVVFVKNPGGGIHGPREGGRETTQQLILQGSIGFFPKESHE